MLYGSPYGRYGEAAFGGSTSPKDGGSAVSGPSDDVIALRHLRAGGGDCFGRLIARWSSFMHVSVYLEAESPCQFPVFQTTHFGALVRLLFHELLGLQLRRLLRWSSIGAREGFYLLCHGPTQARGRYAHWARTHLHREALREVSRCRHAALDAGPHAPSPDGDVRGRPGALPRDG